MIKISWFNKIHILIYISNSILNRLNLIERSSVLQIYEFLTSKKPCFVKHGLFSTLILNMSQHKHFRFHFALVDAPLIKETHCYHVVLSQSSPTWQHYLNQQDNTLCNPMQQRNKSVSKFEKYTHYWFHNETWNKQ